MPCCPDRRSRSAAHGALGSRRRTGRRQLDRRRRHADDRLDSAGRGLTVFFELVAFAKFSIAAWGTANSESDSADLAQELTNPIADLITLPVQVNFDNDIGPLDEGSKIQTNVQPVIPFKMGPDWNLITRTILPIISQDDIVPGAGSQFGLGDTSVSLFFSPTAASPSGIVWGVGPIFVLPTATDRLLGADKWAAGPAASTAGRAS
mgnify:CR=1 FL=1